MRPRTRPEAALAFSGGGCGGADDRLEARLRRDAEAVGADLVGRQRDAVAVDVVRLRRGVDDDRRLVPLGPLVDVADGDHRPGDHRPWQAADTPAVSDHAAVAFGLVGLGDPAPVGFGDRLLRSARTRPPSSSRYDVGGRQRRRRDQHPRRHAERERPSAEATQAGKRHTAPEPEHAGRQQAPARRPSPCPAPRPTATRSPAARSWRGSRARTAARSAPASRPPRSPRAGAAARCRRRRRAGRAG